MGLSNLNGLFTNGLGPHVLDRSHVGPCDPTNLFSQNSFENYNPNKIFGLGSYHIHAGHAKKYSNPLTTQLNRQKQR